MDFTPIWRQPVKQHYLIHTLLEYYTPKMNGFSHDNKGQSFYIDKPSVADNNLITASSTGALLWAKQIIEHLGVFKSNTLESWYEYFSTGEPKHYFALMQTLPSSNEN
jgi:hypothetical protein